VILVRDTSAGRIVLSFSHQPWAGTTVAIARLDETGRARELGEWTKGDGRTLLEAVAELTKLRNEEAAEVTALALEAWHARGDEPSRVSDLKAYAIPLLGAITTVVAAALLIIELF
jgi:hypothetical protein